MVDKTPKFYFSLRSPYSWLAYHDLRHRHPHLIDRLEWIPFWEPGEHMEQELNDEGVRFLYTPMSAAKHHYILRDVRRLARERELTIAWPMDEHTDWEVTHLPYYLAVDQGRGHDYIQAVYRARWQEGDDVCDPKVIAGIFTELGLDPDPAYHASSDPELRRRGRESLTAVERDAVFGVPFFTRGWDKYWGIDRLEAFVKALPTPSPAAPTQDTRQHATDEGHAGGCG
ncbi:2-hydroxychromene-2-carboxylate isomerase [Haloglycomyces albus]|uniref:2-hydroxychromene-2-carboxylate isomerase n=1 Tax=Haloglycomyces albus TaxID=526067 RepID=UPI00046C9F13|nr:DsbA family protein [Haloglycomyces albus]